MTNDTDDKRRRTEQTVREVEHVGVSRWRTSPNYWKEPYLEQAS
jgi:hypothetical protein